MKEEYTPAEADILLLALPGLDVKANGLGGSTETKPGIGGGGYDPDGWS